MATGVEEILASLASAIAEGAAASPVSNDSGSIVNQAAEEAALTNTDPLTASYRLEGDDTVPGVNSTSPDPNGDDMCLADGAATGDGPRRVLVLPPLNVVGDPHAVAAAPPKPPLEGEQPYLTLPDLEDVGKAQLYMILGGPLGPLLAMGTVTPTINFEPLVTDAFDLHPTDDEREDAEDDEFTSSDELREELAGIDDPSSEVDKAENEVPVLGPYLRRAKKLDAALAMTPQNQTDETTKARISTVEGLSAVGELVQELVMGKIFSKISALPEPVPKPKTGQGGMPLKSSPALSDTAQTRARLEGRSLGKASADVEGARKIEGEKPASSLGKIGDDTVRGVYGEPETYRVELGDGGGVMMKTVNRQVVLEARSGSANDSGVSQLKVESVLSKEEFDAIRTNREELKSVTATVRRLLHDMGKISPGTDAGHGIGRALQRLEEAFNYFDEGAKFNRHLKNLYAEKPVRDWLAGVNDITAKVKYTVVSQFSDAPGNPRVTSTHITAEASTGKLLDVTINAEAGTVIDNLTSTQVFPKPNPG